MVDGLVSMDPVGLLDTQVDIFKTYYNDARD